MKLISDMKFSIICLVALSMLFSSIAFTQPLTSKAAAQAVSNQALLVSMPVFTYTLKKNESFAVVVRDYLAHYADLSTLAKFNHWSLEKKLQPGQTIQIPQNLLRVKPLPVQLIALSGSISYKSAKNKDNVAAKPNQLLQMGDVLLTAANSKATILFPDGSKTEMQPNCKLTLKTVGQYVGLNTFVNDVQLDAGRVEVTANPEHQVGNSMRIITPFAVAAVRGTKFRVGAERFAGLEETIEGTVSLAAAGEQVLLHHGFGSLAEKDRVPLAPVELLPAPDLSLLNKVIKQSPVLFDMPKQANVAVWTVEITKSDGAIFESLLSKDNTSIALGDMPDAVYSMRVRGQDNLGLQGFDSTHQFEVNARPFAPVVQSNPRPFRDLPKFSWNKVDGVDHYLVEVSSAENFSQKMIDLKVENNSFVLEKLTPGQYYVRVASIDQAETGAYSQSQAFTYQPIDFVPDFDRDEFYFDDATTVKLRLPALPATLKYDVMLSTDSARQQVVWQKVLSNVNADFVKPASGKYYYSVRYTDDSGIKGPVTTYPIQIR